MNAPARQCPPEHRHAATLTCRKKHGCRCFPCRAAAHQADAQYHRDREAGARRRTDVGPVRDHVQALQAAGFTQQRIAALAGVSVSSVTYIVHGHRGASTRYPGTRVRTELADRVLAVPVDPTLARGAIVDPAPARRRLQALIAMGWSGQRIGAELGASGHNINRLLTAKPRMLRTTAETIDALYERLSAQTPPARTTAERASVSRSKRRAATAGWHPPLAWDDIDAGILADTTPTEPFVDELAVQLVLDGQALPLNRLEQLEVIRRATGTIPDAEISARLGISSGAIVQLRRRRIKDQEHAA